MLKKRNEEYFKFILKKAKPQNSKLLPKHSKNTKLLFTDAVFHLTFYVESVTYKEKNTQLLV